MTRQKFGRTEQEWDEIVTSCVRILEETAARRDLIPYSGLAAQITDELSISPPIDHHFELSYILGDAVLLGFEPWPDPKTAPLLSAIAVYKDAKEPGSGHAKLAKELGRKIRPGVEAEFDFWWREVQQLHDHYAAKS